jgi:TRAP-type uncharacterized transport system fused permease subunit
MTLSKDIHKFQNNLIDGIQYITIILYISIAFGLSKLAPQYLSDLQRFLRIYIGCFLIYRFNIFKEIQFTDLDRKIAFDAGVLLIGSDLVNYILVNYSEQVNNIKNILQK